MISLMKGQIPIVFTVAIAAICSALPAHAQNGSLTTTYTGGNGQDGEMFDVIATRPLTITGIQLAMGSEPLTDGVEIFSKSGTHLGNETAAAEWAIVAAGVVSSPVTETPSSILPINPVTLPTGGQAAFYIRRSDPSETVSYSNGDGVGTLEAIDANLLIFEGSGINGLFGSGAVFPNRIANVTVHYTLSDLSAPTVRIIGQKRVRTSERNFRVFGLASDDVGITQVSGRFRRLKQNGTKKTITRVLSLDSGGFFKINVPTFVGRNPVRFRAFDTAGNRSSTAKAVLIRKE